MYDLHLTAEQTEIRQTVRDFVEGEIRPAVLHPDRLQSGDRRVQPELLSKASRIGLRTLGLSEESGGAGADCLTSCIVMEELGAGDAGVAAVMAQTSMLAGVIFDRMMTPAQRKRLLPRFLDDDTYHLALAPLEADPELRWSYHRPLAQESAATVRASRQQNGDWLIDGVTRYVPNATIARMIAVQARTAAGEPEPITLLVPCDAPGVSVRDADAGAEPSPRSSVNWFIGTGGEITFRNCRVCADHALAGNPNTEPGSVRAATSGSAPQWTAINLGIGRAAYEAAVDYAKLRVQGGRPIIQHQAIGTKLAEIAINLEVARSILWRAAWLTDRPDARSQDSQSDLPIDTVAKVFTSQVVQVAAEHAAECFGAMGVMLDMPLPKYVREARVFVHAGISNSVAKLEIAEAVAGYRRTAAS